MIIPQLAVPEAMYEQMRGRLRESGEPNLIAHVAVVQPRAVIGPVVLAALLGSREMLVQYRENFSAVPMVPNVSRPAANYLLAAPVLNYMIRYPGIFVPNTAISLIARTSGIEGGESVRPSSVMHVLNDALRRASIPPMLRHGKRRNVYGHTLGAPVTQGFHHQAASFSVTERGLRQLPPDSDAAVLHDHPSIFGASTANRPAVNAEPEISSGAAPSELDTLADRVMEALRTGANTAPLLEEIRRYTAMMPDPAQTGASEANDNKPSAVVAPENTEVAPATGSGAGTVLTPPLEPSPDSAPPPGPPALIPKDPFEGLPMLPNLERYARKVRRQLLASKNGLDKAISGISDNDYAAAVLGIVVSIGRPVTPVQIRAELEKRLDRRLVIEPRLFEQIVASTFAGLYAEAPTVARHFSITKVMFDGAETRAIQHIRAF